MNKILVDSSSDINLEEAKRLGIELIPMEVLIDGKIYYDGVDLTNREFFEKLKTTNEFPKTSQITEYRYIEKFAEMTKNGDSVIAICLSSKLSQTYNQALSASKKFENVFVVDSLNASIGERVLIEYAIELAKMNLPATKIVEKLNEKRNKIKTLMLMGTLKYLKKGGRISSLVALAGTILNIKPVISFEQGELKIAGKAIGAKKGNNLLNELIGKCNGVDFDMPIVAGYSDLDTSLVDKYFEDSKHIWSDKAKSIKKYLIGSTIGSHIGPGAIAVSFFEK